MPPARRPFRFAVQLLDLTDPLRIAADARRIEELGYEELYSYDHVGTVDPFAPLVVAATATTSLRVGPLVINNEFHHPALLARTAATVDRMTGGRLVLGMGTGYQQSEHDAIGLELRAPGPRVSRLEESLTVLRSLLDTGACSFDGVHHQVALDRLGVTPVQARVPILLGGHGPRVVAVGGRYADIFQFTGLTHGPGGTPQAGGFGVDAVAERARWLEEAAGDRIDDIERSALVQRVMISDDAAAVTAAVEEAAGGLGGDAAMVASTPFALFGSVAQVVDELERRRESLGISHLVVREFEAFAPVVAALAGR
jgi:probable F420-dependent oxidoreductase